jgi:tetratricopeptide (TPR) repeat protein
MNLGLVEMHFGDKAKAMEWFERALTTDPKNASFFYYAGKMAEILGEHEKAQAWTQEASRLDPKYPSAAIPKP